MSNILSHWICRKVKKQLSLFVLEGISPRIQQASSSLLIAVIIPFSYVVLFKSVSDLAQLHTVEHE